MFCRYVAAEDAQFDSPYNQLDDSSYASLGDITSQEWEEAVDSADRLIAWASRGEWLPESVVDALEGLDYGLRLGKRLQIESLRRHQFEGM